MLVYGGYLGKVRVVCRRAEVGWRKDLADSVMMGGSVRRAALCFDNKSGGFGLTADVRSDVTHHRHVSDVLKLCSRHSDSPAPRCDDVRVGLGPDIAGPNGGAQTVREMKEGPSGSAIRSLIPSHRELLRAKAVVVSVTETSGR